MSSDVKLRHLRAFVTVAECLNFTRASEILGVSQPTLTTAILQLERALSIRLFDRDTRRVTLTETGKSFFFGAKNVIENFDLLIGGIKKTSKLETGKVVVSALPSIAATIASQSIRKFREDYPGIVVHLYDGIDVDVADRVLRWQADFGIGGRPFSQPELQFDPLTIESFFVTFRLDHRFASQKNVSISDVAKEPLIVLSHRTGIQGVVEKAFAKGSCRLNILCEVQQLSTLKSLIETGIGVSIVNSSLLPVIVNEDISARKIDNREMSREIGIITRKQGTLAPAAERFRQLIRAALRPQN